jgi:glycosyltransferase involved in cell wall biosynthesis
LEVTVQSEARNPALIFSVVIPTYNRPTQLSQCLEALAAQRYPREAFEVIVVDDGGTVPLTDIAEYFRDKLRIVFLQQSNAGPASARNTGIKHARGQYIAMTDDDCVPAADWLQQLATGLNRATDQLCGGRILNGLPRSVYSTASQVILDVVYSWQWQQSAPRFFTTNNLAISTEAFVKCGGLNPLFRDSEDREFCDRWMRIGGKLNYTREAVVYHKHHLNFRDFFWQHFNYGRGAFRFYLHRAAHGGKRLRVDPNFYLRLLLHSVKRRPIRQSVPVLGAVVISQLANAGGYLWEKLSLRPISKL